MVYLQSDTFVAMETHSDPRVGMVTLSVLTQRPDAEDGAAVPVGRHAALVRRCHLLVVDLWTNVHMFVKTLWP